MAYTYLDVDLSFGKHPGTKDVLKRYDVEAVKQSLRNLFLTNRFEKPFNPFYGLGIRSFLFENTSPVFAIILQKKIEEQILEFEPRAIIDDIIVNMDDSNFVSIELQFHVIGNANQQSLNMSLERVR